MAHLAVESNDIDIHNSDDMLFYDLSTKVHPQCMGFSGAIFDGRFVYYMPLNNGEFHGQITRYDAHGQFDDARSWSYYDTAKLNANSKGFANGVFDGRYLYLIPYCNGVHFGQVTRYDSQKEFTDEKSWSFFDTTQISANSKGFIGGVFDGRYLYLVPYQLNHTTHHGQVTRYDTKAAFNAAASWNTFDMMGLDEDCRGFHTGTFDGRFVYFCPYLKTPDPAVFASKVVRYDTRCRFASSQSWEVYDVTQANERSLGFIGSVFDGLYLYFVPYNNGHGRYGQVLRYNTSRGFRDDNSWDVYDTCQVHQDSRGFFGALFDGRYIYYIPHCKAQNVYNGQITRYDTRGSFTNANSWKVCDTAKLHPNNKGFIGAVFDGEYLYLPPFETEEHKHSGQTVRIRVSAEDIWE